MSYHTLPGPVLVRMLGSMLTTYYRSRNPTGANLRALQEVRLTPPTGGPPLRVDIAIVEAQPNGPGRVVAVYDVVLPDTPAATIPTLVANLLGIVGTVPAGPETGLVIPESRETEIRTLVHGIEIVTYPG